MITDAKLLYGEEDEVAVLGAVLLDPACIHTFELAVEDFYLPEHRFAWEAMVSLTWDKHEPIDTVSVADEVHETHKTVKLDAAMLADWAARVPTAANVAYYARRIRRFATKRRVIAALQEQLAKGVEIEPDEVAEYTNGLQQAVIRSCDVKARFYPIGNVGKEVVAKLDTEDGLLEEVVPTGLDKIDRRVGGLIVGYVTLIAGRPSMGKSAAARIMAGHQARAGVPVGYISVEDKRHRIALALACKEARVDVRRALMNQLNDAEHARLRLALQSVDSLPLYISDERPLTPLQVCQRLRQLKAEHNIKIAYVDYWNRLKLPPAKANSSRREEANEFVNAMSDIADELGIALVIVAQLNRDSEKEQRRPRLSDLKETGGLEEIAESVILMHRESFYKPGDPAIQFGSSANEVEAIMAKWKTASPFRAVLFWAGRWLSITDEDPGDPDKKPTPQERQTQFRQ